MPRHRVPVSKRKSPGIECHGLFIASVMSNKRSLACEKIRSHFGSSLLKLCLVAAPLSFKMKGAPDEWDDIAGMVSPMEDAELNHSDDEDENAVVPLQARICRRYTNLAPQVGIWNRP